MQKSVTTLACQMNDKKQSFKFSSVDLDAKPIVGTKACEILDLKQRIPVHKEHEEQPNSKTEQNRKISVKSMMRYSGVLHACLGNTVSKFIPIANQFIHPSTPQRDREKERDRERKSVCELVEYTLVHAYVPFYQLAK